MNKNVFYSEKQRFRAILSVYRQKIEPFLAQIVHQTQHISPFYIQKKQNNTANTYFAQA